MGPHETLDFFDGGAEVVVNEVFVLTRHFNGRIEELNAVIDSQNYNIVEEATNSTDLKEVAGC